MTTDLRGLDIADLTNNTGLSISIQSDKEDLVYRNGILAGTGTSIPDAPHVDEQSVLAGVEWVRVRTSIGDEVYLDEPELLRELAPVLLAAREWALANVHGGSPTAQVRLAVTSNGHLPMPSLSHDDHPAGYVRVHKLQTAAGLRQVYLVTCPESGCRVVHVGI